MGLFNNKTEEETWVDNFIDNNRDLNRLLRRDQKKMLKSKCHNLFNTDGQEAVISYIDSIVYKMNSCENNEIDFVIDSVIADAVYETYITRGIARVNKINGILLASQTMKLDTIIEQNNRIIELLEKIANK